MCTIGYIADELFVKAAKRKLKRFLPEYNLVRIDEENFDKICLCKSLLVDDNFCRKTFSKNAFRVCDLINVDLPNLKTYVLVDIPEMYKSYNGKYNIYNSDIFDTKGDDPERVLQLILFCEKLKSGIRG